LRAIGSNIMRRQPSIVRATACFAIALIGFCPASLIAGPVTATARLTCNPGCEVSIPNGGSITKDGEVIGTFGPMSCDSAPPGEEPVDTQEVELSESEPNDLHIYIVTVKCGDTPEGFTGFDGDIPANQEPWGIEFFINADGEASAGVIGADAEFAGRFELIFAPPACPGDTNGDGVVNVDDLLTVINHWGICAPPPGPCAADIAPPGGDGLVNVDDLLAVLNEWGLCPGLTNDNCFAATPTSIGSAITGTLAAATTDTAPPCLGVATGVGVWHSVVGTGATLTASTCASPLQLWDCSVSVYQGGCAGLVCVAAADNNACGLFHESVSWCSAPGALYRILVHAPASPVDGDYTLLVTAGAICPGP
jgi:hypothetical protein